MVCTIGSQEKMCASLSGEQKRYSSYWESHFLDLLLFHIFRLLQRQELQTLRTTSERLSSEVSELRKQLISEKYEKYVCYDHW